MDRSPELTKAPEAPVEEQPKPLPTLAEILEQRTPDEIAAGLQEFLQMYNVRKRLALVANPPPGNNVDRALTVYVELSLLEIRLEALLDELQEADPKRDLRIALRQIKKLHDLMEKMPAITVAGAMPPGSKPS